MVETSGRGRNRRVLGAAGEEEALRYLGRHGFSLIGRNIRCRLGEIDLVARQGEVIVFVEVKGNRGGRYGAPEEMVTPYKQRRLTRLAHWYLQRRGWLGRPARFDVVAVDWDPGGEPRVRHIADAFPASGAW